MSCIVAGDPQLARLADAIAARVGAQRFAVWFDNSTKLDLKNDGLEIAVPNDFISDWIGKHFGRPIQEAAVEVLGCSLDVKFSVMPKLFETDDAGGVDDFDEADEGPTEKRTEGVRARAVGAQAVPHYPVVPTSTGRPRVVAPPRVPRTAPAIPLAGPQSGAQSGARLRHDLDTFVVGGSNQLSFNAAEYVAEYPGGQYNPLFIHGPVGLGKTHLLQGLCKRFARIHPTQRWVYLTGEEFTNDFLTALRTNKVDAFRRKMRDLDLLVIDDVHFLGGKKATQEEFLHTFNAIEAGGKQVVMASDAHPKMIAEFGESLINRFVSGMVVRVDPPNLEMREQILHVLAKRVGLTLPDEVTHWISRRVTQNVRELEGAMTRIAAHVRLSGRSIDVSLAQEALGDLDRSLNAPIRPEHVIAAVLEHFGLESKDLMSGRRQRTISLARSAAMYLIRKTSKLSFPEIAGRMGKRNHSTVISACRRIERAMTKRETLPWTSAVGEREEEANELIQRLEEQSRAMA